MVVLAQGVAPRTLGLTSVLAGRVSKSQGVSGSASRTRTNDAPWSLGVRECHGEGVKVTTHGVGRDLTRHDADGFGLVYGVREREYRL